MHADKAIYKPLFNLQLAATHIAFILDHQPDDKVKIIHLSVPTQF